MKKITTLFKKNPENLGLVINEIAPENNWVIEGFGVATQKYDGTPAAIINGCIYKRFDAKKGKTIPPGAIPCQDPNPITGSHPHWVKCDPDNPEDKWFFQALAAYKEMFIFAENGTFELIGERINGNPENIEGHYLAKHGARLLDLQSVDFDYLREFLSNPANDIEGIVWHNFIDGRMCKLRKSDFGIKRKQH